MRFLIGIVGILLLVAAWSTEMAQGEEPSCVNRCIRHHPKWGDPACRETDFFIEGPACYEVFNACFQECHFAWKPQHPGVYLPDPAQRQDHWRQEAVCDPKITKIPLENLPETYPIDPGWSGKCECRDGQLLEAACGHKKASCKEVCGTKAAF